MVGYQRKDGTYSGTFGQILKKGGLEMKVLVQTGDTDQSQKDLIGVKVLGYG